MTWRAIFAFILVVMIAASIGMAVAAVERSPGWVGHPGAATILREVWLSLLIYAGAIVVVVAHRGEDWDEEMRNAALFGTISGAIEIANLLRETWSSGILSSPVLQITAMLLLFSIWGVAGARTARDLHRFRPGVAAAVMSAGVCMAIAVTAGFAIGLFIAPPEPSYIQTWPEFQRSGWMDARAFGVANTLDSAFTHLWMGPAIALVVGATGAAIGRRWRSREEYA